MSLFRTSLLIALAGLAACARDAGPPPFAAAAPTRAVAVAPPVVVPPKPVWTARKVVPDAVSVPGGRLHTVKPGETGIAIARAYGVDWQRVVTTNHLVPPYRIAVGDKLMLPSRQQVAAMSIEQRAKAFRIDMDDLITGAEPAAPKTSTPRALKPLPFVPGPPPKFEWPLQGRVLANFGAKPGGRFNDGVDLAASLDEPVRATADGVVAYAGNALAGFGNLILIKHADGWVSAYGHNASMLVERGTRVTKGQVIAHAGATGSVAEPQLHFELRRGRLAVDPQRLLPARG